MYFKNHLKTHHFEEHNLDLMFLILTVLTPLFGHHGKHLAFQMRQSDL